MVALLAQICLITNSFCFRVRLSNEQICQSVMLTAI
jgi:hypothetical protein